GLGVRPGAAVVWLEAVVVFEPLHGWALPDEGQLAILGELGNLALDLDPPAHHVADLGDAAALADLLVLVLGQVALPVDAVVVVTQVVEDLMHGPVDVN